jgi:transcriptional regulator with XRE-family HTH domain
MKERIIEFLKSENKSSAQFAEEIGVQPSGISHILSGRNNPSLDFMVKMLEKYKFLSTDWLLFGKGTMYRDNSVPTLTENPTQTLFDQAETISVARTNTNTQEKDLRNEPGSESGYKETPNYFPNPKKGKASAVRKIVWFYDNNEFEEFYPLKS